MVLLDAERKVKRSCCGFGPRVDVAALPNGDLTTDFQNWRISFGAKNISHWKRTKVIHGITKDAIKSDRNGTYMHSRLQEIAAPQMLFGKDYYVLEYQLPRAPFAIRVQINRSDELCRAYDKFATLSRKRQRQLVLRVIPRQQKDDTPVFDERPHLKIKPTRLDTRAAQTRYLVDLYMMNKLTLARIDACMKMGLNELCSETYTILPDHEKESHQYLTVGNHATKIKRLSPEQQYLRDNIDFAEYCDLKDPKRTAKREKERSHFPLPESMYTCIICQKPAVANIKCMECANRACRNCIISKFLDCPTDRAFILMHHIYCLKYDIA